MIPKVSEIIVSKIIDDSYCEGMDFAINPYVGCFHNCFYCYAHFMKDFDHGHTEAWGKFVDVKINALELLDQSQVDLFGKSILISPVCDPYIAHEKRYELTRSILHTLVSKQPEIWILTKSDLVVRDFDVLDDFEKAHVGFTITTTRDSVQKISEPHASKNSSRISALREAHDQGLKTFVFIGPILPYITDWKEIIMETRDCVDLYMFENLKVGGGIWSGVEKWVRKYYPDLLPKYKEIFFEECYYWKQMDREIRHFCEAEGISYRMFFHYDE